MLIYYGVCVCVSSTCVQNLSYCASVIEAVMCVPIHVVCTDSPGVHLPSGLPGNQIYVAVVNHLMNID